VLDGTEQVNSKNLEETIMKRPRTSVIALLAVCVGVCAFDCPRPVHADTAVRDRPFKVIDSAGRERVVVRNANDCGGWLAVAVWGPRPPKSLIGYRCRRPR
jgi:hypothetical protein